MALPFSTCACAQLQSGYGCYIDDAKLANGINGDESVWSFDLNRDPLSGGSGNRDLDQALAQTLSRICDTFDVLPGFAFFNEDQGPNAFASPSKRLKKADGSVVFGQQLLSKLLSAPEHPAAGIAAVCAHEFGHILQYKLNLTPRLIGADRRVKRLELHADYLAGYFSGRRKIDKPDFPAAVFANTQFAAGDNMLNNPQHHGTPEERGQAVVAGFKAAFNERKNLSDAISSGIQYVSTVTP
ncbi:metalloprotease [Methylobacterium radiotolerans]|uniref:metalloprotease n=1 Tax=Methylobacterium radiotolerans TaxID=31998 RepID=UPI001FCE7908|nr:metalloprotease [Methylobacterium radiotolerans]